jgi:transposase-like protein
MPPVNRNQPKRAKSSESEYTLVEFMAEFPNDATCLEWLWRNRYSEDGTNAHCPKCDQERAFARYETSQQRQSWTCTGCGYHIHPTAGTIFHKSSTSLHLWFYAMYLMTSTRCGISAKQLERELGVTYKTAYRMGQLIRTRLMSQGSVPFKGGQPIEMDETYYGARFRRGTKRGRPTQGESHKQPVFGMVQRKGRVAAMTVASTKLATLMPNVQERILPASIVYTDEYVSYNHLGTMGYDHHRIRHAQRVYVSGDVHTNTIEGFWSLVKRGLDGVFHGVSNAHLQGYLNEYAWRYNQRFESRGRFQELLLRSTIA